MTDHLPRLFPSDAAVHRIGEGLLARTLPRPEWTHEAHLAAAAWAVLTRPDLVPERDFPAIIAAYNDAAGDGNGPTHGYHETITQASIHAVRIALARTADVAPLHLRINVVLEAPEGRRDWLLAFYSRDRLFSVEARRAFLPPDLAPLPRPILRPPT